MVTKRVNKRRSVKASSLNARRARRRAIRANEEIEEEDIDIEEGGEGGIDVDPEASDLLFEAEDVAELVAEVTGQDVAVTVDDDVVKFEVGDTEYSIEAEGDEEILETTRRPLRNKRTVKASTRRAARANRKAPARRR